MTHDWTGFARRAADLFQNHAGAVLSPVAKRPVTSEKIAGDEKAVTLQWLESSVTDVTSVTGYSEDSGAYPDEWRAILERLLRDAPPAWTSSPWWSEVGVDAAAFLDKWGSTSCELGWTTLNLFGVHPVAPRVRFDAMGLIPMLRGRTVTTLTQDSAVIRGRSGANLVYRRKPDSWAVLITEYRAHEDS